MLANVQKTFRPAPPILRLAQTGAQMARKPWLHSIVSVLVSLIAAMSELIVVAPVFVATFFYRYVHAGWEAAFSSLNERGDGIMLAQLASTVLPILGLLLYVRKGEKRDVRSMGFVKEKAVSDYLIGAAAAFAMFSACVGVCVATGAMTFDGFALSGQYGLLAAYGAGFLVQGLSEEVVCRGFLMTSLGSRSGALAGMLVNSVLFGCLHLANSNITAFAMVNLVLFGVLMSVIVLKLNSIWLAAALHSVWNFVQGNFYGIRVSGMSFGPSVFRCTSVKGMDWLSGGDFGMEGGAATTAVLTVAILIALLLRPREEKNPVQ